MTTWSISPVVDWLMHKGRHLPTREAVVGELCKDIGEDVVLSSGVAGAEEIFALP